MCDLGDVVWKRLNKAGVSIHFALFFSVFFFFASVNPECESVLMQYAESNARPPYSNNG